MLNRTSRGSIACGQRNQRTAKKARTGSSPATPPTPPTRSRYNSVRVAFSLLRGYRSQISINSKSHYVERHNLRLDGIRKTACEQTRLAVEHPSRPSRILSPPTTRLIIHVNISMQSSAMNLHGPLPFVSGVGTPASVIVLPLDWSTAMMLPISRFHDMTFRDPTRAD
jgi:hypothetical protein